MRHLIFAAVLCLISVLGISAQKVTQGELGAISAEGKALGACPLKNTDVQAEISGFLSRVKVRQEFENNFAEKIEAVYVFPLPQNSAVDDMTMRIGQNGERVVRGKIMQREEARQVYEAARSNGQVAGLLDQERANIFTQSVANILPGEKVVIEISYVETLKYEDGSYEFMFPMTVGPRYIPGGAAETGVAQVPDAAKITPPAAAKDRAGHDISISVRLDAGVPLGSVTSRSHAIASAKRSESSYEISLKNEKTIPNKDFILRYDVAGKKIEDAVLTHRDGRGGYFTLILQPPDRPQARDITPKEIVFVLDTSGSMSGFPIEKAKESMKMALDGLNPQDTFNLITFAGDTHILFDGPVPATAENLQKAQAFLASRDGGGGTEMMKAIKAALDPTDSQQHLRIVCFMTDGYVGNEQAIVGEIGKHPNARVFSFGIGSSVNRALLDDMAKEGRGEVEYVSLDDDGSAAAKRFHERVRSPLLTDIALDFGGLKVEDVYPKRLNDLFSAKPVIIHGRFTQPGSGVIKLKGRTFGRETVREIPVNFPESETRHDVLATLWARTRIDELMSQDHAGDAGGKAELKNIVTNLGIEYRLLTQYTSFVAVEEAVVTDGGKPRTIQVPVELPEGMGREDDQPFRRMEIIANLQRPPAVNLPVNARNLSGFALMQPGTAAQNVIVVSGGEVLQSQTAATGTNITARQITETPITSGDAVDLVTALPGTAATGSAPGGSASGGSASAGTPRGLNDPRNVTPALKTTYKEWAEKDVSYIITNEEKKAFNAPVEGLTVKATAMPKPEYVEDVKTPGVVAVEVTLDPAGKVISAKAVSGDAAFYKTAEKAAMGAQFEIPALDREIVKVTGTIVYDLTKNKTVEIADRLFNVVIQVKPNKYHSVVKALVERLKANQPATPAAPAADAEKRFVIAGKAYLVIRVKDLKPETIAALKAAGVEVVAEMRSAQAVVCWVSVEKIATVAELDAVVFISPQS